MPVYPLIFVILHCLICPPQVATLTDTQCLVEKLQRPNEWIKQLPIIAMSKENVKLLSKVHPFPYYINTNKYRAGWLAHGWTLTEHAEDPEFNPQNDNK